MTDLVEESIAYFGILIFAARENEGSSVLGNGNEDRAIGQGTHYSSSFGRHHKKKDTRRKIEGTEEFAESSAR